MKSIVSKAENLAVVFHDGQTRRDGITPYIEHPRAVVERLKRMGYNDEVTLAVAWLHDVLEDTDCPIGLISADCGLQVANGVLDLTKDKRESYDDYLRGILGSPIPTRVKIADMLCNLADSPTYDQIRKYAHGLSVLAQ